MDDAERSEDVESDCQGKRCRSITLMLTNRWRERNDMDSGKVEGGREGEIAGRVEEIKPELSCRQ